jgi:serine O-acetyltransferase
MEAVMNNSKQDPKNAIPLWRRDGVKKLVSELETSYDTQAGINHVDGLNIPTPESVKDIIDDFFKLIFPGFVGEQPVISPSIEYYAGSIIERLCEKLTEQISRSLSYQCVLNNCDDCDCAWKAEQISEKLLEMLPEIRRLLKLDVQAAYDGDPAAKSLDEIILCYPFIKAITVHRIAHILYLEQVPLIPRIMGEWAHSVTGIDIHPGAVIGESFFIDHGTGVVIGETTEIGNNVKIYQGVTIGALSFSKDERGQMIRGTKRHPTLMSNVTVYANATILGGETVIGEHAVIGGSTWITSSVPARTVVSLAKPNQIFKKNDE